MAGTTRLELATSAVTVSGLSVLSTTWKSTDGTASHWKYVVDNVIVYRDVYRGIYTSGRCWWIGVREFRRRVRDRDHTYFTRSPTFQKTRQRQTSFGGKEKRENNRGISRIKCAPSRRTRHRSLSDAPRTDEWESAASGGCAKTR